MNSFAVVFVAVIAVASANVAGRSGWNAPSNPALPNIELALGAAAAAQGQGQAAANQQLLELASGDSNVPATISSVNGISASVVQAEGIDQLGAVNVPANSAASLNDVVVLNDALATDNLEAAIQGANFASVENSAGTDASGSGALAAEASSVNLVDAPGSAGWRRP